MEGVDIILIVLVIVIGIYMSASVICNCIKECMELKYLMKDYREEDYD